MLDCAADRLRAAGIDAPRLESRLLLARALGSTPEALLRDRRTRVDAAALEPLLVRRLAREPLALILGKREFWSLPFAVSSATLIPRPESETVVEAVLAAFAGRQPPHRVLDLGTGTGCLLLAVLSEFAHAFGVGVDRSAEAVRLAAGNATALGLANRSVFAAGDWAEALDARFDLVLCNPPYIPTSELSGLMPDVALYEPRTALDGGADGLAAYRGLVPNLRGLLSSDGIAVLELGVGQLAPVTRMAAEAGLRSGSRNDLLGIARALVLSLALP
jgi:release factor glutamine methyltransferase